MSNEEPNEELEKRVLRLLKRYTVEDIIRIHREEQRKKRYLEKWR
jgi:hypothetical protein